VCLKREIHLPAMTKTDPVDNPSSRRGGWLSKITGRIAAVALILASPGVEAQEGQGSPPPQAESSGSAPREPGTLRSPLPPTPRPAVLFDVGSAYTFPAEVKGTTGRMASTLVRGSIALLVPVDRQLAFSFPLDAGATFYDFTGDPMLVPEGGTTWATTRFFSIGAQARYRFDEHWTLFVGVNGASAGSRGADFGKTLTGGGGAGFTYSFSRKLTLGVGIAVQTRPASGVFVLPFPILDWELPFDEGHWHLVVGAQRTGSARVAGAAVVYSPMAQLSISAGLVLTGLGRDFRLSSTGAHPNAVGRDTAFPLLLSSDWRPIRNLSITTYVGVSVFRNITLLDQDGNTLGDHDVAPALLLGGGISLIL
jgi:hypothetical protein